LGTRSLKGKVLKIHRLGGADQKTLISYAVALKRKPNVLKPTTSKDR